jgi:hypothetical protein
VWVKVAESVQAACGGAVEVVRDAKYPEKRTVGVGFR